MRALAFMGFGLIHGVVPLLTPRAMMYPDATNGDIVLAGFAALLGITAFSIGYRLFEGNHRGSDALSHGLSTWLEEPHTQLSLRRLFWVSMVLGIVFLIVRWIVTGGSISAILGQGRFEHRFRGGYAAVLLLHAQNLLYVPGFLGFFLTKRHRLIGIIFALVMACLVLYATKGARGMAIGLIGGPLFAYVLTHEIKVLRLINLGVVGALLLIVVVGIYEVRKYMNRDTIFESVARLVSLDTYRQALIRDPLNYHQMTVAAVTHFPDTHPYLNGATYIRIALFFVPRRYFPQIKPKDTHLVFAETITGTSRGLVTIPPTMIGDGYINFWGLPGVFFVMLVNGAVLAAVFVAVGNRPLWMIAIGAQLFGFIVASMRGQPYEIIFLAVTTLFMVWLTGMICGLQWRQSRDFVAETNALPLSSIDPTRGS